VRWCRNGHEVEIDLSVSAPQPVRDEGERRAFVQEAQLAVRVPGVARVQVDPAVEQVAVEIGDQRADVAGDR
jgi:hypothetical protein